MRGNERRSERALGGCINNRNQGGQSKEAGTGLSRGSNKSQQRPVNKSKLQRVRSFYPVRKLDPAQNSRALLAIWERPRA